MKGFTAIIIAVLVMFSAASCISIEDIAMNAAADMLSSESGGANIFTVDDDPQLISDALPLALKLYEMVLAARPEHAAMQYATGKNFVMYANAFIQTPAGMLPDEDYLEQEIMLERAKKMYIRGRDYILTAIELNNPGFIKAVDDGMLNEAIAMIDQPEDAAMLYWAGSGWIGAYSCDPFDFELATGLYVPAAMLLRGLQLDGDFGNGSIHDVFIQIYSSLPYSHIIKGAELAPETVGYFNDEYYSSIGADTLEKKVRHHFDTSIELSDGKNPGTYCSYASSVSVKTQNYREYKELLEKALEIDPAEDPENELVITIYQEKAAWMLDHAEDFFISIEE